MRFTSVKRQNNLVILAGAQTVECYLLPVITPYTYDRYAFAIGKRI